MSVVTVGSYNMSFLNDELTELKDAQSASEVSFLSSNSSKDRRCFWKNSLCLLKRFIQQKNPGIIGLQEINKTKRGSTMGSDEIDTMLEKYYPQYQHVCKERIIHDTRKGALSLIFNTTIFGKMKHYEILNNPLQPGRLLLMVLTEKNYVFVNYHGAKDNALLYDKVSYSKLVLYYNVEFVQTNVERFMKPHNVATNRLLIVGDTNDFFNALHEFTIFGKKIRFKGNPPKSCCYNWESSCTEDRYNPLSGVCSLPDDTFRFSQDGLKLPMYGEEGFTKNYRFYGDKTFGLCPVTEIQIFQGKNKDGQSVESDHQMVYAKYKIDM